MRIAICDDDEIQSTLLMSLINKYAATHKNRQISYSAFSSGRDLFDAIENENHFDIYILDIVMPEVNGIDIGKKLRQNGDDGIIIYLTSSKDYALDSYDTKAFSYLLKPIIPAKLYSVLDDAYTTVSKYAKKSIIVKTKTNNVRLDFDHILYVELCKRIIVYHLANGSTVESIFLRIPFAESMQPLLSDERFSLCGRSTIVNLCHITAIGNDDITFSDSKTVYFSKKNCNALRTLWTDFWSDKGGMF